jgi:transposase
MSRPEKKKTGSPHLRAVQPADAPAAESGGAGTAAPAPAAKTPGPGSRPAEEVTAPRRRSFTADFKREVLAEIDAAGPGEVGAILRRRGLYSSHLTEWRRQREEGTLAGLAPKKRGRKAEKNPLADEVARLERELRRMTARAQRAEGLVEVQKKLAALLGEELPSEEELFEAQRKGLPIPPPRKKR